jgi:6-pyruvoyl-tetrahydropterin synthase related domain
MNNPLTSVAANRTFPLRDLVFPLCQSLVLSMLVVLPFFWLGTASGHDFEFHAPSWLDVAYQWKQGVLFPRWTAWTNHGFGEPRFIFYPPLSWLIGAGLIVALPDAAVPVVFIVLVETFAGLSAYLLLRRLVARRAALLGAAFYVINPNALLLTYIRSDFAEQLACALLPLLLLATLRLCDVLDDAEPRVASLALFALSFAGVWLSNAPAAVMASYSVCLLFAWVALSERSPRVVGRGIAAVLLGFGLAAFYIVPAAYEQRWVNIGQALSSGLVPAQNFLFTSIDDVEHTWFNWIASICTLSLILLLALAALASGRFSSSDAKQRPAALSLLLLGAAATFLTLHWSGPLWTLLPKLRFVQFPWRWISILALLAACFLALAIEKRRGWLWFVVVFVLTLPLAHFLAVNTWWDEDEMPMQRDAITSGHGFDGTDEYDPLGDDHLDLPVDAPLAKALPADSADTCTPLAELRIDRWTTEDKLVHVVAQSDARIALRVLNYPAWRVQLNGHPIEPERMDDVNQMVVPVTAGASDIRIRYTRTADRKIGDVISALSALFLLYLFWPGRRRG